MSLTIDARGRSCPEPVLMTKQALLQANGQTLTVLVDSPVAKENVTRFLSTTTKHQPTIQPQADGSWSISTKA